MKSPKKPILSVKQKKVDIAPFVFMEPKTEYEKGDKVGPFLSDLVGFAGQGHRFHLNTKSHARHITLDEFYKEFPEKVDAVAEVYLADPTKKIYYMSHEEFETPEEMLEHIIDYANKLGDVKCRATNNALDDLTMFTQQILYKLHMH